MDQKKYFRKQNLEHFYPWKKKTPLFPSLDIELTERCNYSCIHCCINQPRNDPAVQRKELSTSSLKKILKEAADFGYFNVRFTGGEPLLRKDFQEIYLFSKKLGFKVILFTNASLINRELADLFAQKPPGRKIEVSVYGMERKSYEAVSRKPGSYQKAMEGIQLLKNHNIPFVVKGAFLPPNKNELDRFDSWAESMGMEESPSRAMFFNLRHRRDSRKKNEFIKKLRPSPEESLKVLSRNEPRYSEDMRIYCSQFMHPQGDRLLTCGAGRSSAIIDPYGFIYPCPLLKSPDTGYNLKNGSFQEAFHEFFPEVRNKKAENPDFLNKCARCFLRGLCEICPGKSWLEHGNLDTPVDYCCEIAHAQAEYLGYIEKGEKGWEIKDWKKRIEKEKTKKK